MTSGLGDRFDMPKLSVDSKLERRRYKAAEVLCHNLCCLVSASFELGVDAESWHIESVT